MEPHIVQVAFCRAHFKIKAENRPQTGGKNDKGGVMKLTPEQLKAFDEQGYVFFPNCFSEEEVALMLAEADAILKLDRQEVWREKTGAPRTAFAAHTFSEVFG